MQPFGTYKKIVSNLYSELNFGHDKNDLKTTELAEVEYKKIIEYKDDIILISNWCRMFENRFSKQNDKTGEHYFSFHKDRFSDTELKSLENDIYGIINTQKLSIKIGITERKKANSFSDFIINEDERIYINAHYLINSVRYKYPKIKPFYITEFCTTVKFLCMVYDLVTVKFSYLGIEETQYNDMTKQLQFINSTETTLNQNLFKNCEWTGSNEELYHLLWQLKNTGDKPLKGTYIDIAMTVKQAFIQFKNTNTITISNGIKTSKAPKRSWWEMKYNR